MTYCYAYRSVHHSVLLFAVYVISRDLQLEKVQRVKDSDFKHKRQERGN